MPIGIELHGGTGFTVSVSSALDELMESVTVKVMLVEPDAAGVPLRAPVEEFSRRPAGSAVEVHILVPLPPLAVRGAV